MADIKIKIIGCGDAFGSGGRLNTCFYLEAANINLLIDCGATVLPGLKKHGIATEQVDAILISHFHGDHYGGIPFLLVEAAVTGRTKQLQIVTPMGGREKITSLLELLYPAMDVLAKLDVVFLEYEAREELTTETFSLIAFPVIHAAPALPHGLRLTIEDKVISYSGDTSWTDELIPLSAEADLFICECNFFNTQVKGHLSYFELESKLHEFSYKRIVLTHLDEEMLQNIEQIKLDCANDGMEMIIS